MNPFRLVLALSFLAAACIDPMPRGPANLPTLSPDSSPLPEHSPVCASLSAEGCWRETAGRWAYACPGGKEVLFPHFCLEVVK